MIDFVWFRSCQIFKFQTTWEGRFTSIRLHKSTLLKITIMMCCSYVGVRPAGENIYLIESNVASAPQPMCLCAFCCTNTLQERFFAGMLCSEWRLMNFLMAAYKVFYWKPERLSKCLFFHAVPHHLCYRYLKSYRLLRRAVILLL